MADTFWPPDQSVKKQKRPAAIRNQKTRQLRAANLGGNVTNKTYYYIILYMYVACKAARACVGCAQAAKLVLKA